MNSVFLAPGERIDILFDFFPYIIGNSVTLQSQVFSGVGTQGTQMDLLRFDITGNVSSGGIVPQNLPPISYYDISEIQRTRTFTLTQSGMGSGMHRINGLTYDMNRIDEIIPFSELEEWKFVNTTNNFHPMHVHGVLFQVYSRNGNTNLQANDKGWKDTVLVNPNETVQTLVKFIDYSGIYLLHCHNLEHEDDGMMINIKIDSATSVEDKESSPESFYLHQNYPNPFNPVTKIKYQIPELSFVMLKVYDIKGNEISKLVNEQKPAGTYIVEFDAVTLPSGVYFYKIQAGSYTETRKMILMK